MRNDGYEIAPDYMPRSGSDLLGSPVGPPSVAREALGKKLRRSDLDWTLEACIAALCDDDGGQRRSMRACRLASRCLCLGLADRGWSLEGRAGMGDALVACVVCQKRTYLHAALDLVGEDAGAPMCDAYCNLRAFKDV